MCPLVNELKGRPDEFDTVVTVTGQHREMLDQVLRVFDVAPDHDLAIMKPGQTLFDVTCDVLLMLKAVLEAKRPDVVLVHGDTTTSFAAALACFYLQIPVGHVEVGLRTRDIYSPPLARGVQPSGRRHPRRILLCSDRGEQEKPSGRGQARGENLGHWQYRHRRAVSHGARWLLPPRAGVGEGKPPDSDHGAPPREPRRANAPHVPRNPPRDGRAPRHQGDLSYPHEPARAQGGAC